MLGLETFFDAYFFGTNTFLDMDYFWIKKFLALIFSTITTTTITTLMGFDTIEINLVG